MRHYFERFHCARRSRIHRSWIRAINVTIGRAGGLLLVLLLVLLLLLAQCALIEAPLCLHAVCVATRADSPSQTGFLLRNGRLLQAARRLFLGSCSSEPSGMRCDATG